MSGRTCFYKISGSLLLVLSMSACSTNTNQIKRNPSSTAGDDSKLGIAIDCTTNSINPFAAHATVESATQLSHIQSWQYFQGTVIDQKPDKNSTGVFSSDPKGEESKSSRIGLNDIDGDPIRGPVVIFVLSPGSELVLPKGFEKPDYSSENPVLQASWFQYDAGDPDDGSYTPTTCSVMNQYVPK